MKERRFSRIGKVPKKMPPVRPHFDDQGWGIPEGLLERQEHERRRAELRDLRRNMRGAKHIREPSEV